MKFIDAFQTEWPNVISILKILHSLLCGGSTVGGQSTDTGGTCQGNFGKVLEEDKQPLEYWPIVKNNLVKNC